MNHQTHVGHQNKLKKQGTSTWCEMSQSKNDHTTASTKTITVQMYRVNKNNNKRCTGTRDENHCAPSKGVFVCPDNNVLILED